MADHDNGASLAWFLAGASLGALGALLYAPQSGRETREEIRRRAVEGRERAYEAGRQAAERGREYYERGRSAAEEAAQSGKQYVERGKEIVDKGREIAGDAAGRFRREALSSDADQPPPAEA